MKRFSREARLERQAQAIARCLRKEQTYLDEMRWVSQRAHEINGTPAVIAPTKAWPVAPSSAAGQCKAK